MTTALTALTVICASIRACCDKVEKDPRNQHLRKTLPDSYNQLLKDFAKDHHTTQTRTFENFKNYAVSKSRYYEDIDRRYAQAHSAATSKQDDNATRDSDPFSAASILAHHERAIAVVEGLTPKELQERGYKLVAFNRKQNGNPKGQQKATGSNTKSPDKAKGGAKPARHFAKIEMDEMVYCWTHGYYHPTHTQAHNSKDCRNPTAGHKTAATNANTMGGSNKISVQN
jgi:hypothetical protein